jgi:site-specific recombinase XerC
VNPASLASKGVDPEMAGILAGVANFGLAANTWKTYEVVINHLDKCQEETNHSMELPFNITNMLIFVGWMMNRGLKASTMSTYISALRMYHLAMGHNEPVLREPIVKLILKGKYNWDIVQKKISGEIGRLPVTALVLKLIKKKIIKADIQGLEKLLIWAVCCILWSGSFRVHEILSKLVGEFDPQTTLLWEDLGIKTVKIDGKKVTAMSFRIKSPKVDRVGTGDMLEVYETGLYNCPVKAFKKWREANKLSESLKEPIFRTEADKCYTGKKLNKRLEELTRCLGTRLKGGKVTTHSFRAGISSEMCRAGFSEQDIQAVGRWTSSAYKLYTKLPMTHRANMARTIAMM